MPPAAPRSQVLLCLRLCLCASSLALTASLSYAMDRPPPPLPASGASTWTPALEGVGLRGILGIGIDPGIVVKPDRFSKDVILNYQMRRWEAELEILDAYLTTTRVSSLLLRGHEREVLKKKLRKTLHRGLASFYQAKVPGKWLILQHLRAELFGEIQNNLFLNAKIFMKDNFRYFLNRDVLDAFRPHLHLEAPFYRTWGRLFDANPPQPKALDAEASERLLKAFYETMQGLSLYQRKADTDRHFVASYLFLIFDLLEPNESLLRLSDVQKQEIQASRHALRKLLSLPFEPEAVGQLLDGAFELAFKSHKENTILWNRSRQVETHKGAHASFFLEMQQLIQRAQAGTPDLFPQEVAGAGTSPPPPPVDLPRAAPPPPILPPEDPEASPAEEWSDLLAQLEFLHEQEERELREVLQEVEHRAALSPSAEGRRLREDADHVRRSTTARERWLHLGRMILDAGRLKALSSPSSTGSAAPTTPEGAWEEISLRLADVRNREKMKRGLAEVRVDLFQRGPGPVSPRPLSPTEVAILEEIDQLLGCAADAEPARNLPQLISHISAQTNEATPNAPGVPAPRTAEVAAERLRPTLEHPLLPSYEPRSRLPERRRASTPTERGLR